MPVLGTENGAFCMIAEESTFGMPDAADARALDTASIGGLTAYPMRITRASFNSAAGAPKMQVFDRQEISAQGGTPPASVAGAVDGSGPVGSISGDVTIDFELRGFGANAPNSTALGLILGSALGRAVRTPGVSQAATYVSANTWTITGADEAEVVEGDVVAVIQDDGRQRFVKVTNSAGTTPATITGMEAHGQNAGTFTTRSCHLWYAPVDGAADGGSLCMQLSQPDETHGRLMVGGRLLKATIRTENGLPVSASCTIRFADGKRITTAVMTTAAPLPLGVSGTTPLVPRVAPVLVTQDHSGSSAPYSGTVSTLPVRTWSIDIDVTLVPTVDQGTRSGMSGMSVADARLSGSFEVDSPGTVDWQDVLQFSRKHSVGFSAAGKNAAGNGFCVWVGAVETAEDPGITYEDRDRKQAVNFRAGDYSGDAAGSAEYENRPWMLAFVA